MGSSRVVNVPTNPTVNSYDSAGGKDYSVLATWESATDVDMPTTTTSYVLEGYAGAHTNNFIQFLGGVSDSSYFRMVRAAAGEGHMGIGAVDGSVFALIYTTAPTTACFFGDSNTEGYIQLHDVVVDFTCSDAAGKLAVRLDGPSAAVVGLLIVRAVNSGAGNGAGLKMAGDDAIVINVLVHDTSSGSYCYQFDGGGTSIAYNCTQNLAGTNAVEITGGATLNSKNCVWDDPINNNGTHNQTTNTTDTPTYRNTAIHDFRLARTDTVCINLGTDLSADGAYPFNDDIAKENTGADIPGQTRDSTWDIGMDEYSIDHKWNGVTPIYDINGVSSSDLDNINGVTN